MSRYIDADALKENCDIKVGNTTIGRRDYVMFHEIDSAPSIEIVRCKECKHYTETKGCLLEDNSTRQADDFCSYGEVRDE